MEKYLTISELAKLFNLNRQTLHFYDKKDVFKPAYVNPENGYRMYSHNQIAQLAFIMYLKTIGFSLDKIKELLSREQIDFTMDQLKVQSELLKKQYEEIFKIDRVIHRKLNFVKEKINTTDLSKNEISEFGPAAYVNIGHEKVLYENEIFYYFPTIVFYHYHEEESSYEKIFGAYIELEDSKEDYQGQTLYTKGQKYLRCYHTGAYEKIHDTIQKVRKVHKDVSLSNDFVCINIVDQFLENNPDKFITEIRIPVLEKNE